MLLGDLEDTISVSLYKLTFEFLILRTKILRNFEMVTLSEHRKVIGLFVEMCDGILVVIS